jgi:hypothetical protein
VLTSLNWCRQSAEFDPRNDRTHKLLAAMDLFLVLAESERSGENLFARRACVWNSVGLETGSGEC